MNQRKTILLTLLGLGLVSGLLIAAADVATAPSQPAPAAAPSSPAVDKMREAMRDRVVEKLSLTPDQQQKFDDLRAKQQAELAALKADQSLAPEDRREKARAIVANTRGQMRALLTPDQLRKADAWREEAGRRMAERGWVRGGNRGPGAAMAPAGNPLTLIARSEQIKDRIAERLQLTDEQRDKLEHLGRAYRAEQRALAQKHREEMRAVLTPEQQEKSDRMFRHFNGGRGPQPRTFGENDPASPEGIALASAGPEAAPVMADESEED